MMKSIYLTIDDSPSQHSRAKVDILRAHDIPAVFFCRGECIRPNREKLIEIIQNGFLIGNHSFSHPHFSKIPLHECFEEILRTENLIDACFEEAGITRPAKLIRLPFADRGAGDHAHLPQTPEETTRVSEIQDFLKAEGFRPLLFSSFDDPMIDAHWTWNTEDYKQKHIESGPAFEQALQVYWHFSKRQIEIMLVHDFKNNHHLFEITITFLLGKGVKFLAPEIG